MPSRMRVPGTGIELSSSQPTRRMRSRRRWGMVPISGTAAGPACDTLMRESYYPVPGTRYGAGRAPHRGPPTADRTAGGGLPLPPCCTEQHLAELPPGFRGDDGWRTGCTSVSTDGSGKEPPDQVQRGTQGHRHDQHARERNVYPQRLALDPNVPRQPPEPAEGTRPGEQPQHHEADADRHEHGSARGGHSTR